MQQEVTMASINPTGLDGHPQNFGMECSFALGPLVVGLIEEAENAFWYAIKFLQR